MLRKLSQVLPVPVKEFLRPIIRFSKSLFYRGKGRFCPVCETSSRRFGRGGIERRREDAICMHCGSAERHRLTWIYFGKMTNLFDKTPKKMLHVAPEPCFEAKLRRYFASTDYVTADLLNPRAMVRMDITDIQYPDEYFDVIYCSHVLEHVEADKKAMEEFYRVLKQGGWAVLNVPITAERTIEDPSVVSPSERLKVFGQEDHVRRYGPDYIDKLHEAGFRVHVSRPSDLATNEEIIHMGLTPASGEVFYCSKE